MAVARRSTATEAYTYIISASKNANPSLAITYRKEVSFANQTKQFR